MLWALYPDFAGECADAKSGAVADRPDLLFWGVPRCARQDLMSLAFFYYFLFVRVGHVGQKQQTKECGDTMSTINTRPYSFLPYQLSASS